MIRGMFGGHDLTRMNVAILETATTIRGENLLTLIAIDRKAALLAPLKSPLHVYADRHVSAARQFSAI